MNPSGEFEVSISGATRDLLFRRHERAAVAGLGREFLVALRALTARLRADPVRSAVAWPARG